MAQDDAIVRLARQIDATRQAEQFVAYADAVARLRRKAACELHARCAEFVSSLNSRLSESLLELSPPVYSPEAFRESGTNLMQISSQGRQMQIAFTSPAGLVSTEKFMIPYILEGEIRTYNQRMLERFEIWNRMIFCCAENETAVWRYYDWRTRSTGAVDRGLLVTLMQPLF
jgi:hypothetical protein